MDVRCLGQQALTTRHAPLTKKDTDISFTPALFMLSFQSTPPPTQQSVS